MTAWRVGMKCRCINDMAPVGGAPVSVVRGQQYTVQSVHVETTMCRTIDGIRTGHTMLRLAEVMNHRDFMHFAFDARRFEPLTNTDLFNELLRNADNPVQGDEPAGYPRERPKVTRKRDLTPSERLDRAWRDLDSFPPGIPGPGA